MNKKQKVKFQRTLQGSGFRPWYNVEKSLEVLAGACAGITNGQGAIFFYEFYPPLREFVQGLYDSKQILHGSNRKRWFEYEKQEKENKKGAKLTGDELKELEQKVTKRTAPQLDSLSLCYLQKVKLMSEGDRGFKIATAYDILRRHFNCTSRDSLNLVPSLQKRKLPAIEDYVSIIRRLEELTETNKPAYFRYQRSLDNLDLFDGKKTIEEDAEILRKLDLEERKYRGSYFLQLLSGCKRKIGNCPIAYKDLGEAVSLVQTYLPIKAPITGRNIVVPIVF